MIVKIDVHGLKKSIVLTPERIVTRELFIIISVASVT